MTENNNSSCGCGCGCITILAMIAASGLIAAFITGHPVFTCAAIGAGILIIAIIEDSLPPYPGAFMYWLLSWVAPIAPDTCEPDTCESPDKPHTGAHISYK